MGIVLGARGYKRVNKSAKIPALREFTFQWEALLEEMTFKEALNE